jgi:hypothetical protein
VSALASCVPGGQGAGGSSPVIVPSTPVVAPIRPDGLTVVPVLWSEAEVSFVKGAVAYDLGNFHDAAEAFFHVAEALEVPPAPALAPAYATNRLLAYHNAALAWSMAGELTLARQKLDAAADSDADCRDALLVLAAQFPPADAIPDVDAGDATATPSSANSAE